MQTIPGEWLSFLREQFPSGSHIVSVGNETQYEAVMSCIQGLSIGIVIVTTILLFLRVVLVLYTSGAG